MWRRTAFTAALDVRLPLVVAPMAGGPSTPALVAAAGQAGALGVLGAAYLTPDQIRAEIREVRRRTAAPFGVNLFVAAPVAIEESTVTAANRRLEPFAAELGLTLEPPSGFLEDFDAQLEAVLSEGVAVFTFTFGIPAPAAMAAIRAAGSLSCGTATTVAEAVALEAAGVDLICAQGTEAGGHRGGFLGPAEQWNIGLTALVPLICDAVSVPIIAAGGLMDGRGIVAALALGACAAQLGTAFLRCPEAGTSAPYRRALAAARETDTTLTTVFSGRPARGLRNRMTEELSDGPIAPYPAQNALTRAIRREAAASGKSDYLSLWAGHGVPAGREMGAGELVATLERETDAVLRAFG